MLRYSTAIAAYKAMAAVGYTEISEKDFDFLTQDVLWINNQRNRAENILRSVMYSAVDMVAMPRFPLPAEFVAAAIVKFVHSNNWQIACTVMEGVESAEDIIEDKTNPLTAKQLYAHVLQVAGGDVSRVEHEERKIKQKVKENA